MDSTAEFYDAFSEYYHLIFDDWQAESDYQAREIETLLKALEIRIPSAVLDVTCGIGTQAIGLARLGYKVTGIDLSAISLRRARLEAEKAGVKINLLHGDIRDLSALELPKFPVVISFDNSLPCLLTDFEISGALEQMKERLLPGGYCLISVRDYEQEPSSGEVFKPYGIRRLGEQLVAVYQLWEFDGPIYRLYWYFVPHLPNDDQPRAIRFESKFYAIKLPRLMSLMRAAGFVNVRQVSTTFYQPMIIGQVL